MATGDPKSPAHWANVLARAWGPRFPVDVRAITLEYSTRFEDPVAKIAEAKVDSFEGALYYRPKNNRWFILYNPTILSPGRINYTLAHELGHYLNHRQMIRRDGGTRQCGERAILGLDADGVQTEREADTFASFLLMPLDDFREQVANQRMTLDLLRHCADRYGTSLTAAALKWISSTVERAVFVVARDGFVLWSRSSDSAFKSGVYFRSGTPLPMAAVAARPRLLAPDPNPAGVELPPGVWVHGEPVREMTLFADSYEVTITLLVLPRDAPPCFTRGYDDEESAGAESAPVFRRR